MAPEPAGTLTLHAAELRYQDFPPVTNVKLAARVDRAQVTLESLDAQWQAANVSATGVMPLRMLVPQSRPDAAGTAAWGSSWLASLPADPRTARLNGRVTGITTEAARPFVDAMQLEKIAAQVDATITAEAGTLSLDTLRASVTLDRAAFELAGVPLVQSAQTCSIRTVRSI